RPPANAPTCPIRPEVRGRVSADDEVGGWLIEAVESGDPRRSLPAQRHKLAQVLELTFNRDAAILATGIQEIDRLLEKLEPAAAVTQRDELRKRRERHWSSASGGDPGRRPAARADRRGGGQKRRSAS